MLLNMLKIAVRTLLNHKGYSFINILGLAIGFALTVSFQAASVTLADPGKALRYE